MSFLKSTSGRSLLAVAFLLTVNVLSGWLAVTLGYPSLWGNQSGIFGEYALPITFTWALAHWLSMLPLTLLILGLPLWQKSSVNRFRLGLIVGLLVCFAIETDFGFGRLQKTPFVLFIAVDLLVALVISLLFYVPRYLQVGGLVLAGFGGTAIAFQEQIENLLLAQGPVLKVLDTEIDDGEALIRYHFEVIPPVDPDSYPRVKTICQNAEALYDSVHVNQPEDYTTIVLFWARTDKRANTYPAGSAGPNYKGEWVCSFNYPRKS